MATLDVNGHSIHYDEFGDLGNPLLVLVHGLMGDASTVTPLARRLALAFHVVAPDALGHGRSSHPEAFTLADQGAMINGLVDALGAPSAILVGVSMGSYVVAQASVLEPAKTNHLVLVVSKAHGTTSSSAAFAASKGIDLARLPPEEMLALMSEAIWSPDTPQERRDQLLAEYGSEQIALTPDEQRRVEGSMAGFDLRPGLPSITAPTLVISGAADGLNPPASGKEVADLIPGSRFEIYEHSGHMLVGEEEDRLVEEILAFAAA